MLFKILNNTLNNVFLNSKFLNRVLTVYQPTKIEYFRWLAKDTKAVQPCMMIFVKNQEPVIHLRPL